jgi:hypothetical protein
MTIAESPGSMGVQRAGAGTAALSLGLAAVVAFVVSLSATELGPIVWRLEVAALVVLVLGIGVGAERLVALATAPALGGAALAFATSSEVAWGRSLVVGCLWYLAVESALASVGRRDEADVSPAVRRARRHDVATVVAVTAVAGAAVIVVGAFAPTRTLVVRVAVSAAVVSALVLALRHQRSLVDH